MSLSNHRGHPTSGGLPSLWLLGGNLTFPHRKKVVCYGMLYRAFGFDGFLRRLKQRKTDIRFGIWSVRGL